VGFGFLSKVIPSLPVHCQFSPVIHIHHLGIVTHIIQLSYSWSSYPSAPNLFPLYCYSYHPWGVHSLYVAYHLILWALISVTMAAPLIMQSSSTLFLLSKYFPWFVVDQVSNIWSLFLWHLLRVQVLEACVSTDLLNFHISTYFWQF
jgi:hypothetical protein